MKVTAFTFRFKHGGEIIPADCKVMEFETRTQYRVALTTEDNKTKVFVFYKTGNSKNKFFWFPLPGNGGKLAQSIANGLALN